jgi:hypothetical protein
MVSHELPPEIFVEKVIPFVDNEFLDLSQFRLGHEWFDVPVLANRWFYPIAIECIKPLVLIAQSP